MNTLENDINKDLEKKLIKILHDLLSKKNTSLIYHDKEHHKLKQKNYLKLYFLYDRISKDFVNLRYFILICTQNLLINWDKPLNVKQIFKYIEKNIHLFWLFLIYKLRKKEEKIKVINLNIFNIILFKSISFLKIFYFY